MSEQIVLTDEELLLIINRRIEKQAEQRLITLRGEILSVASRYYDWLIANQCGNTFSTFVDEFGYPSDNAKYIHDAICELFQVTKSWQ